MLLHIHPSNICIIIIDITKPLTFTWLGWLTFFPLCYCKLQHNEERKKSKRETNFISLFVGFSLLSLTLPFFSLKYSLLTWLGSVCYAFTKEKEKIICATAILPFAINILVCYVSLLQFSLSPTRFLISQEKIRTTFISHFTEFHHHHDMLWQCKNIFVIFVLSILYSCHYYKYTTTTSDYSIFCAGWDFLKKWNKSVTLNSKENLFVYFIL